METLFIYIAKSSGLIGMFYLAYYFLLRKETFFTANRWFLLAGLLTSVILPWIVFTTIVWVEPTPTSTLDWSKIPRMVPAEETFEINWYLVLAVAYTMGTVLFLAQFALDFYKLNRVLKGKTSHRQADHKLIDLKENIAPFSYFNTIVYNSSLYNESEMESILEHEKVHSEQYHTIDVLITRFFCILFWFNPFMWLYKNAILQNLEFIADSEASKNIADKKVYQLTLLKITTHENCVVLTNHFYQSLIKKRIVMLNKNQSKKWNYWKYAVVLPLLGVFLFFFQMEVIAKEKVTSKQENTTKSEYVDLTTLKIEKDLSTLSKGKEIIINGEKSSEEELAKLDSKEIKSIDTTKIADKPTILVTTNKFSETIRSYQKDYYIDDEKSTYKEYGKLDLNNIEVEANPFDKKVKVTTKKSSTHISAIDAEEDGDKNFDYDKALIIIDGKESDYKTLLKIKDREIKFVYATPFKNTPDENKKIVLAKYGDKARNGVMVVETSPLIPPAPPVPPVAPVPPVPPVPPVKKKEASQAKSNAKQAAINAEQAKKNADQAKLDAEQAKIGANQAKLNSSQAKLDAEQAKIEASQVKSKIGNTRKTALNKEQWLETYKVIMKARFSLEKMNAQKEQAKVDLEKAKKILESKLFS